MPELTGVEPLRPLNYSGEAGKPVKTSPLVFALASLVLLGALPGRAQAEALPASAAACVVAGETLVDALAEELFATVVGQFSLSLQRTLPEKRLRQVWLALTQQVGPFQRRTGTRVELPDERVIVLVRCEFKEFTMEARIEYNRAGQVTGLFFHPAV
jgi:hypothetical protein